MPSGTFVFFVFLSPRGRVPMATVEVGGGHALGRCLLPQPLQEAGMVHYALEVLGIDGLHEGWQVAIHLHCQGVDIRAVQGLVDGHGVARLA